jgi:DNA topoisomerase-1
MRHLVIVESPSKCKTIEGYLGDEYRVIATCGHFRSLNSLEQINTSTLEINFKITKPKIVKFLKEEIGIAKSVFLATDDDREGEAIAWHICKVCKIPLTTPRIIFHEITKQAIQKAISCPTTIHMPRVMAQHTRQLLDVYIGFTISPLLWKAIQHTLSAGRCQTPALHMIAEQEETILQQKKETSFRVKGYFTNKQIEFSLERPLSQEEVEPFLSNIDTFTLEHSETKDVTLSPPPILTTSILQQKSSQLHMSPKHIMSSAQVLYEHGLITYMRTDQATYSDEFINKAKHHLGNDFHSPRNKSSDGAHEGIRVTRLDIPETAFDKNTDRLYAFLYKYTLQTCMKPTLLCHKIYRTLCQGLYFIHTSVSIKEKGWSDTVEKDWSSYLDNLTRFHCERIQADEKLSQEFHWNESHLIRELEKNQIGRPSTYTHILESIKDKKYVELGTIHGTSVQLSQYEWKDKQVEKKTICQEMEEKNKLSLTPLGKEVNEFCYQHFESLFNYSFTSIMETRLDEIEQGLDHTTLMRETLSKIDELKKIKIEPKKYPSFHAGLYRSHALIVKKGMYGYYLEYKDQSISLKEFNQEKITHWIEEQTISQEDRESLIKFKDSNENVLLTLDSEWSLRKGQYGPYLFYKTKKMKKPKFYTYPHSQKKEDIEEYIRKNIKT